jgi:hypothetical protein
MNDHALVVPHGLAAGEQLEAAGVLRVPVEALALNPLERDAAARACRRQRVRLGRRAHWLFSAGYGDRCSTEVQETEEDEEGGKVNGRLSSTFFHFLLLI